jgi:hypothetical protein
MNRATRDKFATRTDQTALDGGNACWETAPKVFAKLNEDFGPFDLDLTANTSNHLAPWFGPGSPLSMEIDGADRACTDCLIVPWHRFGHNGYSNPPYGRVSRVRAPRCIGSLVVHESAGVFRERVAAMQLRQTGTAARGYCDVRQHDRALCAAGPEARCLSAAR